MQFYNNDSNTEYLNDCKYCKSIYKCKICGFCESKKQAKCLACCRHIIHKFNICESCSTPKESTILWCIDCKKKIFNAKYIKCYGCNKKCGDKKCLNCSRSIKDIYEVCYDCLNCLDGSEFNN